MVRHFFDYNAITGILAVGTAWVLWLRPWLERRRPHPSIPMIPCSHWLFGHLFWLIRVDFLEKQKQLMEHADEQGRCSVWMGFTPSICCTTPADAQSLLWKNHARRNLPLFKHHFQRLAGQKNLLLLNGKEWKYYQSALKTALSRTNPFLLQSITLDTTETLTRNLRKKLEENSTHDDSSSYLRFDSIESLVKMIFIDIFGRSAFSHDFGSCSRMEPCAFAEAFEFMEKDVMERCTKGALLPQNFLYWMPTTRNSKFKEKKGLVRSLLGAIIQKRRSDTSKPNDILTKIIEAHSKMAAATTTRKTIGTLSDEDLIDILLSILLAGYETVSTTLTYAIYRITKHPEWEKQCLDEINRANIKDQNHCDSSKKELDLPICRGVIMETLRLYPIATGSSRTLEKDIVLKDGVIIPKGYHAGVSFWLIHRSDRYFPRPDEFRPDRWISANCIKQHDLVHINGKEGDSIPPGSLDAFFAFSGGGRGCPGRDFALEEATLAFAWLIKDIEFCIDPNFKLEIEWKGVVQKPKGGIPATVQIRRN